MQEKTCEPWLLHEFQDDFYGEELRLVVRPPACAALQTPSRTRSIDFESGDLGNICIRNACNFFGRQNCIALLPRHNRGQFAVSGGNFRQLMIGAKGKHTACSPLCQFRALFRYSISSSRKLYLQVATSSPKTLLQQAGTLSGTVERVC